MTEVVTCDSASCGCCQMIEEQAERPHMRQLLQPEDAHYKHFQLDKPSSDSSKQFYGWAKKTFGQDVQQCGKHLSCLLKFVKKNPRFQQFSGNLTTVITFKKLSFREYFPVKANYFEFHDLVHRVLQEPTLKIAALLQ
jgi:hypothetical protein